MSHSIIPFGMLLEEKAQGAWSDLPTPHYDPIEQLTFIEAEVGQRVPYVLAVWATAVTRTVTEIKAETTDSDQTPFPSTVTETMVRAESSDSD